MTAVLTSAPPRFRSVPLHVSSAGQDCIDLAAGAGLDLYDWQQEVIRAALGRTAADRWAALEFGLIVTRQNGKNRVLAARQLWGLFLNKNDKLQTHTAHRADTCFEQHRFVSNLILETPELRVLVKDNGRGIGDQPSGIKDSNGKESIELADGSRLIFRTRSKGSGRGFSGDAVYFDEAYYLNDLGSMLASLSAQTDPQIWYTSSAPHPVEESDYLRSVIRRGRAADGEPLFGYFEWSAASRDDEDALWQSNPSRPNGHPSDDFVTIEQRTYTAEEYDRERLGIFPDKDDSPQWLVISQAAWGAGDEVNAVPWIEAPTFSVEVEPGDTGAVIVAAGKVPGGDAVELIDRRDGTDWLTDRLAYLVTKYAPDRPVFVDDGSDAHTFAAYYFGDAGITYETVKTSDVVQSAADLVRGVNEGTVLHRSDEDQALLTEAVSRGQKRNYGDTWLWDRRVGAVICPLIAVSLALWGSRNVEAPTESVYEDRGMVSL